MSNTQDDMMAKNKQLGHENVTKLLFKLAIPAVAAQLINILYNIVDRMYIGRMPDVGGMALTGVGVCMPIIILISAFAALASMGAAPKASVAMGSGNKNEAEHILGNSVSMLLVISLILTAVFLLFGKKFLWVFGASENTITYAWEYLSIYVAGTLFVQLALGLNIFITAQGFATTSMLTVLIGAVLNIVLDPIFIFVFGWGVKGAALATILSQMVSAIWVVKFLFGKKTNWRIKLKNMRPSAKIILPSLALGLSPFIMQSTESIINVVFNTSLRRYGGDAAVGTMAILASIMQFSMLPLVGLTQGAQPIVSYNYGAKNSDRVRKAFRVLLISCITYSTLLWLVLMLFPHIFPMMFTKDPDIVGMSSWAIRIYFSANLLFGIQLACQQTLIAIGNAKSSVFLALLRKIILLIPLIYILPNFFADKVFSVFLAEPVADTLAVMTTSVLFYWQFTRRMKELDEISPLGKTR